MSCRLSQFYAHVIRFWFFEAHAGSDSCHIYARGAFPLVYLQKEIDLRSVSFLTQKETSFLQTRSGNFKSKGQSRQKWDFSLLELPVYIDFSITINQLPDTHLVSFLSQNNLCL